MDCPANGKPQTNGESFKSTQLQTPPFTITFFTTCCTCCAAASNYFQLLREPPTQGWTRRSKLLCALSVPETVRQGHLPSRKVLLRQLRKGELVHLYMDEDVSIWCHLLLIPCEVHVDPLFVGVLVGSKDQVQHGPIEAIVDPMMQMMILMEFIMLIGCFSSLVSILVGQLMFQQPIRHAGNWQATAQDQNVLKQKEPIFRKASASEDMSIPSCPVGQVMMRAMSMFINKWKVLHAMDVVQQGLPRQDGILHQVVHQG